MNTAEFRHLFGKARDAKRGGYDAWACQSTGEKVTVALVLNRTDWLSEIGYTIPEAIDRAGPEWVAILRDVERALHEDRESPTPNSHLSPRDWIQAGIENLGTEAERIASDR